MKDRQKLHQGFEERTAKLGSSAPGPWGVAVTMGGNGGLPSGGMMEGRLRHARRDDGRRRDRRGQRLSSLLPGAHGRAQPNGLPLSGRRRGPRDPRLSFETRRH
jgi:hypothetical protein